VIFFARYEASQYGSSVIDTEHILLGLLREDTALLRRYVGGFQATEIRTEIEGAITRGAPISTSVEVPLAAGAKKILYFAGEEADRLGHRHIGTEHVLLGIFRLPDSLAARVLLARGAKPNAIREQIAKGSLPSVTTTPAVNEALATVHAFLSLLKGGTSGNLADFFHDQGQFVDSTGKRWLGREEIGKDAEILLAPFAKKNASFRIDDTTAGLSDTFVASVLWELASASTDRSKSMLRMSIVLAPSNEEWTILLVQVTPVALG
jgi:hypothetical protein